MGWGLCGADSKLEGIDETTEDESRGGLGAEDAFAKAGHSGTHRAGGVGFFGGKAAFTANENGNFRGSSLPFGGIQQGFGLLQNGRQGGYVLSFVADT